MFVRGYLRASTDEQDATRAKDALVTFAEERGLKVAAWYTENESGAKLKRPELFRLLAESYPGDVLLIEQVDRLSRLNAADWDALRQELDAKKVRVVAVDLPTSWIMLTPTISPAPKADDFMPRMFAALNDMMLDMLAAVARKDYEDRRRRQAEGITKAKTKGGKFVGRREDAKKLATIASLLKAGESYTDIMDKVDCSRATVAKVAKRMREAATV